MLKKYVLVLSATLLTLAAYVEAPAQTGIIINPDAVDYPLIRSTPYTITKRRSIRDDIRRAAMAESHRDPR